MVLVCPSWFLPPTTRVSTCISPTLVTLGLSSLRRFNTPRWRDQTMDKAWILVARHWERRSTSWCCTTGVFGFVMAVPINMGCCSYPHAWSSSYHHYWLLVNAILFDYLLVINPHICWLFLLVTWHQHRWCRWNPWPSHRELTASWGGVVVTSTAPDFRGCCASCYLSERTWHPSLFQDGASGGRARRSWSDHATIRWEDWSSQQAQYQAITSVGWPLLTHLSKLVSAFDQLQHDRRGWDLNMGQNPAAFLVNHQWYDNIICLADLPENLFWSVDLGKWIAFTHLLACLSSISITPTHVWGMCSVQFVDSPLGVDVWKKSEPSNQMFSKDCIQPQVLLCWRQGDRKES